MIAFGSRQSSIARSVGYHIAVLPAALNGFEAFVEAAKSLKRDFRQRQALARRMLLRDIRIERLNS